MKWRRRGKLEVQKMLGYIKVGMPLAFTIQVLTFEGQAPIMFAMLITLIMLIFATLIVEDQGFVNSEGSAPNRITEICQGWYDRGIDERKTFVTKINHGISVQEMFDLYGASSINSSSLRNFNFVAQAHQTATFFTLQTPRHARWIKALQNRGAAQRGLPVYQKCLSESSECISVCIQTAAQDINGTLSREPKTTLGNNSSRIWRMKSYSHFAKI